MRWDLAMLPFKGNMGTSARSAEALANLFVCLATSKGILGIGLVRPTITMPPQHEPFDTDNAATQCMHM